MNFMFAMLSQFVNQDQTLVIPTSILTIPFYHILLQYHLPRIKSINHRLWFFIFYSSLSVALSLFAIFILHYILGRTQIIEIRISFIFIFLITGGGTLAIAIYLDVKVYPEINPNALVHENKFQNKHCSNLLSTFRYSLFRNSLTFFSAVLYVILEIGFYNKYYLEYLSTGWLTFLATVIVMIIGGLIIPFGILKINSGIVNVFAHVCIGISLMYSYVWKSTPYLLFITVSSIGYFTGYYTLCFDLISLFHIENLFVAFILFFLGMQLFAGSVLIIFGCIQWISYSTKIYKGTEICTGFIATSCFVGFIINLIRVIKKRKDKIKDSLENKGNDLME